MILVEMFDMEELDTWIGDCERCSDCQDCVHYDECDFASHEDNEE